MNQKKVKGPISNQSIYNLMVRLVYIVSPIYLVKNLIEMAFLSAGIIAVVLIGFTVVLNILKKKNATADKKQIVVSMSIIFLLFVIGISSGSYYSDDYILYMAVVALSGLYFEPKVTKVQLFLVPSLLVVQFFIHPGNVESVSQFIMCLAITTLAVYIVFLLVKRGQAYIQMSDNRANEAEELVESMKDVGAELKESMRNSALKYEELDSVNNELAENAEGLRKGSESIMEGTLEVVEVCDAAHEKIQTTEQQIGVLNAEVGECEEAIVESRKSLVDVEKQMNVVQDAMTNTNEVFSLMEQKMREISDVIEEINKIASSTTMLALNASIEAARAGESGKGFAVVATKVQDLAVNSSDCSKRVNEVLAVMQHQINDTTKQLSESTHAIEGSMESMKGLQDDFEHLTTRFERLYKNIEEQNVNIKDVDNIFEELKGKVSEMSDSSEENRAAVETITQAMDRYQENLRSVIEDSKHVSEVSEGMLNKTIN